MQEGCCTLLRVTFCNVGHPYVSCILPYEPLHRICRCDEHEGNPIRSGAIGSKNVLLLSCMQRAVLRPHTSISQTYIFQCSSFTELHLILTDFSLKIPHRPSRCPTP